MARSFLAENDIGGVFFAPLVAGRPEEGMGAYNRRTGRCEFYSDGGQWFFEMGTGKPAFYVDEGAFYGAGGLR